MKIYTREQASVVTPITLGTNEPSGAVSEGHALWIQVAEPGTVVARSEDGSLATFVCGGGEVLTGRFSAIVSSTGRIRYGNGPVPPVVMPTDAGLLELAADLEEISRSIVFDADDPRPAVAAFLITRALPLWSAHG